MPFCHVLAPMLPRMLSHKATRQVLRGGAYEPLGPSLPDTRDLSPAYFASVLFARSECHPVSLDIVLHQPFLRQPRRTTRVPRG